VCRLSFQALSVCQCLGSYVFEREYLLLPCCDTAASLFACENNLVDHNQQTAVQNPNHSFTYVQDHSFLFLFPLLSLATRMPAQPPHMTHATAPLPSSSAPSKNAPTTRDYRLDRVRVFIEEDKTVARAPAQG
jgi:hypothetical protein